MTKVLLIEDDPLIHRLYRKLFKLEGYNLEIAENGELGLEKLKNFHPDIILLDIMMPTMNGMEMLTHLKSEQSTQDIPVIVLTNMSDMVVANMAISRGAVLCIIKSQTEPDDVVATIKGVLERAAEQKTDTKS